MTFMVIRAFRGQGQGHVRQKLQAVYYFHLITFVCLSVCLCVRTQSFEWAE